MIHLLDSNTHQNYLSAVVRGLHNETFTGFPLGGLSAEVKISEEVIQRQPAFFTSTMVPKHSSQPLLSLPSPEVWIHYCSPPCVLMPINLSWCQTICLEMPLCPPSLQRPWQCSVSVSFTPAITLSSAFFLPAGHSITAPACQLHACP